MPSGGQSGTLDEYDVHALVDGQIQDDRRAVALRVLATSAADRARVEAWQGQNDLLRSTFAGIERETLPAMLDLSAKARLQCIPANDAPLVAPTTNMETGSARRVHVAAVVATIFVIVIGLGGSWLLLDSSRPDANAQPPVVDLAAPISEEGLSRLPTTRIPDLTAQGLRFAGTETRGDPATLLFQYKDGKDSVVVSASRASSSKAEETSAPIRTSDGYGWRRHGSDFSVSGSAKPDRLRALAVVLMKAE